MTSGNGDTDGFSIVAEHTVPDIYTDSVQFEVQLYGITLVFGKGQITPRGFKGPVPPIPRIRVHMSPQHAKVMALAMRRNIQAYEEAFGRIVIPKEVLESLGVPEDEA